MTYLVHRPCLTDPLACGRVQLELLEVLLDPVLIILVDLDIGVNAEVGE